MYKLPDLAIGENVEVVMETAKFFEGFVESIEGLQVLSLLLSALAFTSTKVQILTPEEVLLLQAGDEAAVPVTFPSNHKVPQLRGRKAVASTKATSTSMYMCPGYCGMCPRATKCALILSDTTGSGTARR